MPIPQDLRQRSFQEEAPDLIRGYRASLDDSLFNAVDRLADRLQDSDTPWTDMRYLVELINTEVSFDPERQHECLTRLYSKMASAIGEDLCGNLRNEESQLDFISSDQETIEALENGRLPLYAQRAGLFENREQYTLAQRCILDFYGKIRSGTYEERKAALEARYELLQREYQRQIELLEIQNRRRLEEARQERLEREGQGAGASRLDEERRHDREQSHSPQGRGMSPR